MALPRSLPLLFLLLLATPLLLASVAASARDEDLDYIIDNADDIPANDPEGWLQEGSSSDDDLFGQDSEDEDYGAEIDETHVVLLAAANFSSFLAARRHAMVEFYAPWCGHCRALAPDYAAAAAHLAAQQYDVALAKVDATEDAELAEQYGVQGFPTLLFFIDGVHKEYSGERTKYVTDSTPTRLYRCTNIQSLVNFCLCSRDAIVAWISKKLGPGVQNITTVDEAERILTGEETAVLGED
jgi:protein disulfide-isomerase A1